MGFGALELLVTLTLIILIVYYYASSKLTYWRRRGIPGPQPVPLFGNFAGVIFRKTSIHECISNIYAEWRKYPFIGAYRGHEPLLIITDLDVVKDILIKDFPIFCGRGIRVNETLDPLTEHLFNLDGSKWKTVRTKLTPVFTSGKLRLMFDLMLECADHFEAYLHDRVANEKIIEFREVAAKFTTDVIGSCAFGISMNALARDDSEFRKVGRRLFEPSHWALMKRLFRDTAPGLYDKLKLRFLPKDITDFFISSMRETIAYRKRENIIRHDLVDTLLEIQEKHDNKEFTFNDGLLAAQAFVFFVAGFETSSTSISFGLYELAHAQEVQRKLINEISKALKDNGGRLSFDVVKNMKYLEMVVQEILRKNPPGTSIIRQVFQHYVIPGTNVLLEPGTKVLIPVYAIHRDSDYYPNPDIFDPERFSDEAKRTRHSMAHLPFGDGPKNCIGARFASYQVKLGLIKVLKNYCVQPTELSPYPYEIDKGSFILTPKGGLHLKLKPIEQDYII